MGIEPAPIDSHVSEAAPRPTPPAEDVLLCLERVLQSSHFSGSPQLSRFLRYVVEQALAGNAARLKESTIGIAVFQRPAGYDPKADPIVRVEARRLRARLEAYNTSGGVADPVRIDLPRGGYAPAFGPPALVAETLPAGTPLEARPTRPRWWVMAGLATVCFAAVMLARAAMAPDVTAVFWGSILSGDQPALVIPADSSLVTLQNWMHRGVSLEEYTTFAYLADPKIGDLGFLIPTRYTSIADLEMSTRLAQRPEAIRRPFQTRYARDVRAGDLKGRNVILIGSRHSNPWVELYEAETTFRIQHDETTRDFRLVNTAPQTGEISEIVVGYPKVRREAFAIVCYHRKEDSPTHVLMVAGMSSAGTEAAADFVLNNDVLRPWLRKAESNGALRGFDVLLRTSNLDGRGQQAQVAAFHLDRER